MLGRSLLCTKDKLWLLHSIPHALALPRYDDILMLPLSVNNDTLTSARKATILLSDNTHCPSTRALLDFSKGCFPLLPKMLVLKLGSLSSHHPTEEMVMKNKHHYYWLLFQSSNLEKLGQKNVIDTTLYCKLFVPLMSSKRLLVLSLFQIMHSSSEVSISFKTLHPTFIVTNIVWIPYMFLNFLLHL